MTTQQHPLAKQILKMRGKKSYGLIAKELGTPRNVVAGVIFRFDWPAATRISGPRDNKRNRSGTGRHGGNPYAAKTLPLGAQVSRS